MTSPTEPEPSPIAAVADATAAIVNHSAPANDLFGAQWCGATLVAARTLLTAAHCVLGRRPGSLDVVIGADNLCKTSVIAGERLRIIAVRINPDSRLDLATLTTSSAARTRPIPISARSQFGGNARYFAEGWGRSNRSGPSPCTKQAVPLTAADPEACRSAARNNPSRWHPSQLCASATPGSSRNTCIGDSGGPMYQIADGRLSLIAVVNWGTGCAADKPGFYSPAQAGHVGPSGEGAS
ncbi:trypsin-like serine protease [Kribbella sp. NPDC056951]|uniref:trypsin-like serine protease n=1 Tax=Kribbella sp. NPDC056951 TaxID=3345978 RepID=UPI00363F43B2